MNETPEQVERHTKILKRTTSLVSFFLTGMALGGVVAKVVNSRKDRPSNPPAPSAPTATT
jgi:hypothetical protein